MKNKISFFLISFFINSVIFAQPANDDPCGAIFLTVQTGTSCTPNNPFSWTGATASAGIPDPGCGSYLTGDIWWFFTAPASGKVNISTAAGTGGGAITDGAMAVYSPAGPCSGSFTLVSCDDDSGPGFMPYLSLTGLNPGFAYYIRFWDFNDATSGNIGGICVTDPDPPLASGGGVGIGIQNPDEILDINGAIKIRGGVPGLNKVLTSDANGLAGWTTLAPVLNPVPFKGTNTGDILVPNATSTYINFNVEEYDVGSNFSSGIFTAPATGIYHFDASISWYFSSITSNTGFDINIEVAGSGVHFINNNVLSGFIGSYSQMISADLSLSASQTVRIRVAQGSGTTQTIFCNTGTQKRSYFSGHRIN